MTAYKIIYIDIASQILLSCSPAVVAMVSGSAEKQKNGLLHGENGNAAQKKRQHISVLAF